MVHRGFSCARFTRIFQKSANFSLQPIRPFLASDRLRYRNGGFGMRLFALSVLFAFSVAPAAYGASVSLAPPNAFIDLEQNNQNSAMDLSLDGGVRSLAQLTGLATDRPVMIMLDDVTENDARLSWLSADTASIFAGADIGWDEFIASDTFNVDYTAGLLTDWEHFTTGGPRRTFSLE